MWFAEGKSFEDCQSLQLAALLEQVESLTTDQNGVPGDILGDKEALELVRSYYAMPENQRRRLFELARVMSDVA